MSREKMVIHAKAARKENWSPRAAAEQTAWERWRGGGRNQWRSSSDLAPNSEQDMLEGFTTTAMAGLGTLQLLSRSCISEICIIPF